MAATAPFAVGDRVKLTGYLDRYPCFLLEPGPTGVVSSIEDSSCGTLLGMVRLDVHVPELDEWENEVQVISEAEGGEGWSIWGAA